jgi:hypothetical protein
VLPHGFHWQVCISGKRQETSRANLFQRCSVNFQAWRVSFEVPLSSNHHRTATPVRDALTSCGVSSWTAQKEDGREQTGSVVLTHADHKSPDEGPMPSLTVAQSSRPRGVK